MKRLFKDYNEAEDFVNDIVFGGDDPTIMGELVEVWPDANTYEEACQNDAWGVLYAVWGTEAQVEAEMYLLGEFIDRKGITARPDPEES